VVLSRKLCAFEERLWKEQPTRNRREQPIRNELHSYSFTQSVSGMSKGAVVDMALRLVMSLTLVVFPLLLLTFFQLGFLPYHSEPITWWHRGMLFTDAATIIVFARYLARRDRATKVKLTDWWHGKSCLRERALTQWRWGLGRAGWALSRASLHVHGRDYGAAVARIVRPALRTVRGAGTLGIRGGAYVLALNRFVIGALVLFSLCVATLPDAPDSGWDPLDRWMAAILARAPVPYGEAGTLIVDGKEVPKSCWEYEGRCASWLTAYLFERKVNQTTGKSDSWLGWSRNLIVTDKVLTEDDKTKAQLNLRGRDFRYATLDRSDLRRADFYGAKLKEARLEQTDLSGASFRAASLQGANLARATLQGANLGEASLEGTNLENASLEGANLVGANLHRASLRKASLGGANLEKARLQGAVFVEASLPGVDLRSANLEGADLGSAGLQGADLTGASLQGADLSGASLQGAHLRGANLSGADLSGARLHGADLGFATLMGVDLSNALLQGVRFADTSLHGADLRYARLQGAVFVDATLWGADLRGADLQGADLRRADLQRADLSHAGILNTRPPPEPGRRTQGILASYLAIAQSMVNGGSALADSLKALETINASMEKATIPGRKRVEDALARTKQAADALPENYDRWEDLADLKTWCALAQQPEPDMAEFSAVLGGLPCDNHPDHVYIAHRLAARVLPEAPFVATLHKGFKGLQRRLQAKAFLEAFKRCPAFGRIPAKLKAQLEKAAQEESEKAANASQEQLQEAEASATPKVPEACTKPAGDGASPPNPNPPSSTPRSRSKSAP
jgi:uncharacterized protein YjbI with pentapeptide repeats